MMDNNKITIAILVTSFNCFLFMDVYPDFMTNFLLMV